MRHKQMMIRRIHEYDFAIHELVLFLGTHPTNKKALELLAEYRVARAELIEEYEKRHGPYIVTPADVPITPCFSWHNGPWPWENESEEG